MYGIATTDNSNTSDDNRMVLLEVTGILNAKVRNAYYKIKVPYTRLSQTVQRICKAGGKIKSVTMDSFSVSEVVETVEQKEIVETVAGETVEKVQVADTSDCKVVVEEVNSTTVEHNLAVQTVADETVVVEIVPQIAATSSKKTTAKAQGMGQKQPKSTKRDRKSKSKR